MNGHEDRHPDPTPEEKPAEELLEWKTPELISEEITGVTEGGTGFNIPPDRGTLYSS